MYRVPQLWVTGLDPRCLVQLEAAGAALCLITHTADGALLIRELGLRGHHKPQVMVWGRMDSVRQALRKDGLCKVLEHSLGHT